MHAAAVVESENLQELVGSPLLPQVSRDVSGLQVLSRLVGLWRVKTVVGTRLDLSW